MYDVGGKETARISLAREVFGIEADPRLIAQYIRVYRVNQRQGNAATKTRSEVIGTTKKVYRQKGTGRARHGSQKAPIFVGGGVSFGPQPRYLSLKMNKKQKIRAFLGALNLKAKGHAIGVMSNAFMEIEPKTKVMAAFLKQAGLASDNTLLVYPKMSKNNLLLAARNLPNIYLSPVESLNAYEVLKFKRLLFIEDAVKSLRAPKAASHE